ncbi:MAG: DUF6290 family protein, partial [Lachnospiraceae bacterium]|nr:DUF6290 family protein [Lachnospiraceae bacterium]
MKDTSVSIRMNKEEKERIQQAANMCNETVSAFSKRILLETISAPLFTRKDMVQILGDLSYDMLRMTPDN